MGKTKSFAQPEGTYGIAYKMFYPDRMSAVGSVLSHISKRYFELNSATIQQLGKDIFYIGRNVHNNLHTNLMYDISLRNGFSLDGVRVIPNNYDGLESTIVVASQYLLSSALKDMIKLFPEDVLLSTDDEVRCQKVKLYRKSKWI